MGNRRYSATPQHKLYLHEIFPRGGPRKQGNRFAGLLPAKGGH
jgi:tRNA 2-thiouridine synthesizing protein E